MGPDRDHGRRDQQALLDVLLTRGGHLEQLPGGARDDRGEGPVLLAVHGPGLALLGQAGGGGKGEPGEPDPVRAGDGAARDRDDPGVLAGGAGPLGARVPHPPGALAEGAPTAASISRRAPVRSSSVNASSTTAGTASETTLSLPMCGALLLPKPFVPTGFQQRHAARLNSPVHHFRP